tara:strand:+ start:84 stop:950 length:867 start_codon:yes stop_codon:yes gene_type:complete
MEKKFNTITIVLISHRSKELVVNFIKNLSKEIKILIVDNSDDLILKKAIDEFDNVKIMFTKNKGYGSSINFAKSHIKTKYFFVFSPDVKIIDNNIIELFQKKIPTIDNFGALGPRFMNVNNKTHKQSNIDKEIDEIEAIHGSAMLFETSVFDKIGGFDENIFLFFEEIDFCKRSRKMGYNIFQLNTARVIHPKGKRSGVVETKNLNELKKLKNFYSWHFMWSKFYINQKQYSYFLALIYFLPVAAKVEIKILYYKIKKDKDNIEKYKARLSGLVNSMMKKKSNRRLNN